MGVYLEDLTYKEILPILARTGKLIDTRKIIEIDLVRCGECKYYNGHEEYCEIDHFARENGFCSDGKRRIDYTVFTVNPPKGIETPLRGDATVFHKNSKEEALKEIVKDYITETYGGIDNL